MKTKDPYRYLCEFQKNYGALHQKVKLRVIKGETKGLDTHRVMLELGKLLFYKNAGDTVEVDHLDMLLETAMLFSLQGFAGDPVWQDTGIATESFSENMVLVDLLFVLNHAEYIKLAQRAVNNITKIHFIPEASYLVNELHQKMLRVMKHKINFDIGYFSNGVIETALRQLLIAIMKEYFINPDEKTLEQRTDRNHQDEAVSVEDNDFDVGLLLQQEHTEDLYHITVEVMASQALDKRFLELYFSKRIMFFLELIWLPENKKRERLLAYLVEELKFFSDIYLRKFNRQKLGKPMRSLSFDSVQCSGKAYQGFKKILDQEIFQTYRTLLNFASQASVDRMLEALIHEIAELRKLIHATFLKQAGKAGFCKSNSTSVLVKCLASIQDHEPMAIGTFVLKDLMDFKLVEIARLRFRRQQVASDEVQAIAEERGKIHLHIQQMKANCGV